MNKNTFEQVREYFVARDLKNLRTSFNSLVKTFEKTNLLEGNVFFHPLGFAYTELFVFSNRDAIRINIWSTVRHPQTPSMEIHDHFYNINSFVIAGKLTNIVYDVSAVSPNHSVYKGTFDSAEGRTLKRTEECLNAEISSTQIINQGDFYYLPKGSLHSSYVPPKEFTCTFVLASQRDSSTSRILGPLNGLDNYFYQNRTMDTKTLKSVLGIIACE